MRAIIENRVAIGSTVLIEFLDNELNEDRVFWFKIESPGENNSDFSIISHDAPLTKALLGKQTGETVKYSEYDKIRHSKFIHQVKIISIANKET